MAFPAFWVDMADQVELALRRWAEPTRQPPCPSGYHEASVPIGRAPIRLTDGDHYIEAYRADEYAGDERWPTVCQWCNGYTFVDDDHWQVFPQRIYRRPDTGDEWPERKLPPGAMLDGYWHPQKGPDGIALVVVLPPAAADTRGHWWHVDGPSRNNGVAGPGWKRTGDPKAIPPTVAAQPSIATDSYHGYLRLGPTGASELSDHIG